MTESPLAPPGEAPGGGQAHDHERTRARLSAYLDGDLTPAERRSFERDLASCAACTREAEQLRATLGQLGSLKRPLPSAFLPSVQQQINRRSRGRFFARRRWLLFGRIPFEWVSLVMLLAMLVYYIVTTQGAPTHVAPG